MQKCRSCQVDDERNVEVWCRKKKRETGVTIRDGVRKVLTAKRDAQLATSLLLVIWVSVMVATSWQIWSAHQRTLSEIDTNNRNLAQTLNTYAELWPDRIDEVAAVMEAKYQQWEAQRRE